MEATTSVNKSSRFDALWPRGISARSTTFLALGASALTLVVLLMYRPFNQPEIGDHASWDYLAQSIVRGEVPYTDVIANKTPASAYFSAVAILLGKPFGLRDVMAIRLFGVLLATVLSALTYLVTEAYFRNRVAALTAFMIPLICSRFDEWMVAGTEPKLSMITFGVLTLWLISKDKPFWAGLCSMLSCLAWQPGLLFSGVAFLVFSRYLTSWRDLRALKVALGAAVPLGLLIGYFAARRSLGDLWFWTMTYNYGVYAPATARTLGGSFGHMWRLFLRVFGADVAILLFSLAGYVTFGWRQVSARFRRREKNVAPELFRDAVLIAPAVYFLFCLVNLQAGPDLIPLFPFIGMFAALSVVEISSAIAHRHKRLAAVEVWAPRVALIVVLALAVGRAGLDLSKPIFSLQQQDTEFEVVSRAMAPDDKLYVHGTLELLVLLNRRNLNKYTFLDRGKDDYIDAVKEGGIDSWIEEMESQSPRIVALSRLKKVAHRDELMRWVETRYESLELPGYEEIYVRKP